MANGTPVYISFNRSEDLIRHSFLSHLSTEFRRRRISLFSGEEPVVSEERFCEEIDAAISKAKVSVVIFSVGVVNAYPKCCPDEILKVSSCRRSNGLMVVPVFYGLTKSILKKHCLELKKKFPHDRVADDWREALIEIADLPGFASSHNRSDSKLVEDIVADVREKLDRTSKIGIYSRLMKIENLLSKQPCGLRSLGIWGMGGIGKTTLAEAAFKQFSGDFEASCFIKEFDIVFEEKGAYGLLDKHFREQLGLSNGVSRLSNLIDTLSQKRILLVLDGVRKPLGARTFLYEFDWLGSGSLIIITSRDKQVLVQCRVNEIYEVQGLNKHEALQLFSQSAFGKNVPDQNLLELSRKFVDYSNGNPLALSIYGSELENTTPSQMESLVFKLKARLPDKIFDLFKSSFDTLTDSEKEIFLQIACFLRGGNVSIVMQLLEGCGFFPRVGIDVLVEKSLVTVSKNVVQMHNLIYEFGLKIIKDQTEDIGMGYRILDASNFESLLQENQIEENGEHNTTPKLENEDIKALILETTGLAFKGHVAFQHMFNLRYLKITSVSELFLVTQFLPPGLRLLHWEYYSLQSFPQDFFPQYLVELNMPHSKLRKLWGGTKNLEVLKRIMLGHSLQLVNVDELQYCQNIENIDLRGCLRLKSFPETDQLQHLQEVNLSTCADIKAFSKVSLCITKLDLQGTSINKLCSLNQSSRIQGLLNAIEHKDIHLEGSTSQVKVSSSHQELGKLVFLKLKDCFHLRSLPKMVTYVSLEVLDLSGCSKLENIQDLPGNLKELYLIGTSVKELSPLLLENLSQLLVLDLENCEKLKHLQMGRNNLNSLDTLKLSGCSKLKKIHDFPLNLKELYLAGTAIRELPPSIGDLAELATLDLKNCKRLRHLPKEMKNLNPLQVLDLSDCSELEVITSFLPKVRDLRLVGTVMPLPGKLPSSFLRLHAELVNLSLYKACLEYIPEEICWMYSLKTLDLSGNSFKYIPVSIKEFSKLLSLRLRNCKKLISLPELPRSLQLLNAHGCLSLRSIPLGFEQLPKYFTYSNCFHISPQMVDEVLVKALAIIEYMESDNRQELKDGLAFSLCVPSRGRKNTTINMQPKSSTMITLTPYRRSKIMGVAILVEVSFSKDFHDVADLGFRCVWRWNDKEGRSHRYENTFHCWASGKDVPKIKKDHMFVFCDLNMLPSIFEGDFPSIFDDLVVFELFPVKKDKLVGDRCKVTKFGVYVINDRCKIACKNNTSIEQRRWSQALTDAANIDKESSQKWKSEAEIIENVAEDISMKLNLTSENNSESQIRRVDSDNNYNLDEIDSSDADSGKSGAESIENVAEDSGMKLNLTSENNSESSIKRVDSDDSYTLEETDSSDDDGTISLWTVDESIHRKEFFQPPSDGTHDESPEKKIDKIQPREEKHLNKKVNPKYNLLGTRKLKEILGRMSCKINLGMGR